MGLDVEVGKTPGHVVVVEETRSCWGRGKDRVKPLTKGAMTQLRTSEINTCSQSARVGRSEGIRSYCTFVNAGHIMTIIPTTRAAHGVSELIEAS
jgi:hypothetical protein